MLRLHSSDISDTFFAIILILFFLFLTVSLINDPIILIIVEGMIRNDYNNDCDYYELYILFFEKTILINNFSLSGEHIYYSSKRRPFLIQK